MVFNFVGKIGKVVSTKANQAKTQLKSRVDQYKQKLNTISVKASEKRLWAGHTASEAAQLYSELYALGSFVKANYYVIFEAYRDNDTDGLPLLSIDGLSGYLVTETNLPILEAEFDETKVAGFYINSLSAMRTPDLQMTLIETEDSRVYDSLIEWAGLMINQNGTLNPPASYAMKITVGLFSKTYGLPKYSKSPEYTQKIERTFLVAPSQASIDGLSSRSFEGVEIPITFKVLRPLDRV